MTEETLLKELNDAKEKIKKLEDFKRKYYIKAIKNFGNKYSDEELATEDLEGLKKIADACARYSDGEFVLEPATEVVDEVERIDFSRVFEDVSKDFNMTKFKKN